MHTIRVVLEESARSYPARAALQLGSSRLTYRQLRDKVVSAANYLKDLGISADKAVAFLFQNTPVHVIGFLALAWLNAYVIPLEPEVTATELLSIFQDIPFSAIVGTQPRLSQLERTFAADHNCSSIDLANLLAKSPRPEARFSEQESANRAFLYHYTSGSTGKPKAALHTQANLVTGGSIYGQTYHITPGDSILVPIPLSHSFGMIGGLIASLLSGSRLVLVERFVPHLVVQILAEERISMLLAVPLMYDLMARCSLRSIPDLGALRVCLSSGGTLPAEIASNFSNRYHRPIYQVYGSTETGVIATQWPAEHDWPQHSIGHPLMGVQIRIVDDAGRAVPPYEPGNLLVKTATMFSGYLNNPEATARAFRDGWYITGDLTRLDREGNLYLIGRKDTFINVGGRKVNPLQVEEVLCAHPLVKEAVVFGRETGHASEEVHAIVVATSSLSEAELLAFCRKQLPAYKVPSAVKFAAELPKTGMGKLRRHT